MNKVSRKSAVAVPSSHISRSDIDRILDAARMEQRSNAACRALIEANERLVQQVFDLASILTVENKPEAAASLPAAKADQQPETPAVKADRKIETPTPEKFSASGAFIYKDGKTIGEYLRSHRGRCSKTTEYRQAHDDMIAAIIRNYRSFGGYMSLKECARYLDVNVNTIYAYGTKIRKMRAQAAAN